MDYISLLIAVLAAIHAYTYAKWLKENENKAGAYGVYVLILTGLTLPVYRIVILN
ncbi:MAG: hypothetical protein GX348_01540 [Veillonellaceae bacterium]|jgi:hypothetical protein|nr:hypothetical protein [Veillonellaceae bacterium]